MRRIVPSLTAVLLVAFVASSRVVTAQSVTNDQLSAAALSSFDLSNYEYSQDGNVMTPQGFDAAFLRTFATADNGGSLFIDTLFAMGPNLAPAMLAPRVTDGTVFNGFRSGNNAMTANYQLTGPLGIGDTDQSAVWDSFDAQKQTWSAWYADAFMQGKVLAVVIYIAPQATADGAALAPLATLQEEKLLTTDALPPDVIGAPAR